MKIRELISKEEKWCKGAMARDKSGNAINCLDMKYFDDGKRTLDLAKNAVAFSLQGAICRCYEYDKHEEATNRIHAAMETVLGKDMYIAEFNDHEKTTFKELQDVIKEAGV